MENPLLIDDFLAFTCTWGCLWSIFMVDFPTIFLGRGYGLPSHHRCGGQCDRRGSHCGGHGGHFTFDWQRRTQRKWMGRSVGYIRIYRYIYMYTYIYMSWIHIYISWIYICDDDDDIIVNHKGDEMEPRKHWKIPPQKWQWLLRIQPAQKGCQEFEPCHALPIWWRHWPAKVWRRRF